MAKTPQQQESRRLMMANDPIPRVIFKMAIPTIVAFLINSIYSLADTYFVSGLGKEATAAVTVNASLDQLIMMAGSMLAVGANSYIARLLGQGNTHKANQVLSTAFYSAFALGALVMLFGNLFMTEMVRLLGATPTCEQYSIDYATYVLYAAPFMAASFVMNQCLRSEGSATLSMIGMGFGGVLNCILDPVFILGSAGLKEKYGISLPFQIEGMGVAGASLATAISKWVSFGILIFPYLFRRSVLRISVRHIRFNKDIVGQIVAVGSSSMFRSGLAVVAGILLNQLAGEISDSVLGGMGVSTKIMMFPFSIILGFGTGFQPVAGFNWGAKKYDRVLKSYRFSSLVAIVGAVIMSVGIAVFIEPLIRAFAGNDAQMLEFGKLCTLLQCVALPIHAWVAVVNMLCAGLGNAWGALALSTARQGSCMIPILYPLAYWLEDKGLAAVQALADVLSLAIAIPIILYMIRKIHTAQENICK